MIIDNVEVIIKSGEFSEQEIRNLIERGRKKHGEITSMILDERGDNDLMFDVSYKVKPVRFDRIRRITGYLVGTLDRFNDGKRAEVNDRVKHM